MRSIWSGAISFGLVNIPIKLYSATSDNSIDFDMLDSKDLSPIRYARISTGSGREVPYDEIVKGHKYQGGDYVIIEAKDFEKVNVAKTKTIDIVDFVDIEEIDTIYYEKPYYLEPDKSAGKSYYLLREALKKSKKVAVSLFVLRNKEHLAVLKPYKDIIVLNQLRFDSEIRKPNDLKLPDIQAPKGKELEMALALIEQLSSEFDIAAYKDTYTEELQKLIEHKAEGKPIRAKGKAPKPTQVHDLMSLLKASLKEKKKKVA